MAYATNNPPIPILSIPYSDNGVAKNWTFWAYIDGDAAADMNTDGYFSDGQNRGMAVGDLVFARDTTNNLVKVHQVLSLSTSNDSVDLDDGTTIGSATDGD